MRSTVLAMGGGFTRTALRKPMYLALAILPPVAGLFVRALPLVLRRFLPEVEVQSWLPYVAAVMASLPPYLTGFLAGMMLLDDRDCGVLPAYRVSPVSDRGVVAAKLLPALGLSALGILVSLRLTGVALPGGSAGVAWALAFALFQTPFNAFLILSLASSKVQSLTIGKVLGVMLLAPVAWALIPRPWNWLMVLIPAGWNGPALLGERLPVWILVGGLLLQGIPLMLMARIGMRRYFRA